MTPAHYFAQEYLRDGRPVEIRALRPDDEADMLVAIGRTGAESLQRRFFVTKRSFSDNEKAFFMNIDFVNHVALVAVVDESSKPAIVGGSRYVVTDTGVAEVAFVVIDAFQGQGIGALLTRHLTGLARAVGLKELIADVLPGRGNAQGTREIRFPDRAQHGPAGRSSDTAASLERAGLT
jgi:GNAT superfamily N-acetyltransferase